MVNRWAASLDPKVVAYRQMTYSTALAVEEMRKVETMGAGIKRLFSQGSLLWLMSRPFVAAWRFLRRKLRRPYWLATFASDPD